MKLSGPLIINQPFQNHLPKSSGGWRSDPFKTEHVGEHILFAGCSMTMGDGLEKEDTWGYKTYQKIAETKSVDGFYNIAQSGFTCTEIINYVYKYINDYGKPDAIFIFLPDPGRDMKYVMPMDASTPFPDRAEVLGGLIYNAYFALDMYCKAAGIKLIASTWVADIAGCDRGLFPGYEDKIYYPGSDVERPHWKEQLMDSERMHSMENSVTLLLSGFESFHPINPNQMEFEVFKYDNQKKGKEKKYSLIAADAGAHPGTSFHDYWSDYMFNLYQNA
jgi:hypothetical protein